MITWCSSICFLSWDRDCVLYLILWSSRLFSFSLFLIAATSSLSFFCLLDNVCSLSRLSFLIFSRSASAVLISTSSLRYLSFSSCSFLLVASNFSLSVWLLISAYWILSSLYFSLRSKNFWVRRAWDFRDFSCPSISNSRSSILSKSTVVAFSLLSVSFLRVLYLDIPAACSNILRRAFSLSDRMSSTIPRAMIA